MTMNLGNTDRTLRILAAVVLTVLILAGAVEGTFAVILGIVTVLLLITGAIAYCPAYKLLRISTRKQVPARG